jgi:cytoskeletal protein RodZ
MPQTQIPGSNPRKRRSSPPSSTAAMTTSATGDDPVAATAEPTPRKKGRTNTPWTAEEEQRLKTMRDAGRSWSEIAKVRKTPAMLRPLLFLLLTGFSDISEPD